MSSLTMGISLKITKTLNTSISVFVLDRMIDVRGENLFMCGIIGIVGDSPVAARLLDGLKKLEYRGYDSAGIATVSDHSLHRRRAEGKLFHLAQLLGEDPIPGTIGVGHTRWATHGSASVSNAHPHSDGCVTVVHNGIIENCDELRAQLREKGITFESQTDTEVIVHLVSFEISRGHKPLEAVRRVLPTLRGYFALAFLFRDDEHLMMGARQGSPLVLGVDDRELFLASDATALSMWTNKLVHLEDGDIVTCRKDRDICSYEIFNNQGESVKRSIHQMSTSFAESSGKGPYAHYMLKEIFEQPRTLMETYQAFTMPSLPSFQRIHMVACGTSHYVGCISAEWFEERGVPVACTIASEFKSFYIQPGTLYIFISQSGETIDTLTALQKVREVGCPTLAIVNVAESPLARQSDTCLLTQAGPEIGVASTKASTAQLLVLHLLACGLKGGVAEDVAHLSGLVQQVLDQGEVLNEVAERMLYAHSAFYLGRGQQYPVALEAALKLKEISYIHAEGFAAGELKHGPIALIDASTPVIALAPSNDVFDKIRLAIEQVKSRGATVIALTDEVGAKRLPENSVAVVLPTTTYEPWQPFVWLVAGQLLAYYTALLKGTDVDQPRNLAKSVTVE